MCKDKWIDLKDLLYILKQPKALQRDLINECLFSKDKISIDFDTVDQVIDFIKKFNTSNSITNTGTDTIKIDPNDWKQPWNPCNPITQPYVTYEHKHDLDTYKVADPVPNPYTVTVANIKQVWTKNN